MVQESIVNPRLKLTVVVGATSSGKSAFAEDLSLRENGEILNADSQQFYRGFDIGTGKTPLLQRRVPQHLLDLCAPGEFITAADFASRADAIIQKLTQEGRVPVVVGGTGLYIRSLLEGLDPLPPRDEAVRRGLMHRYQEEGGAVLHRQLSEIDPLSAAKIHPNDPVRLVRYLEIYQITGKAPSQLMRARRSATLRYVAKIFWLQPEREALRNRIAARVRGMFRDGWVEEVRGLMERGIDPARLQNRPIGYAEIAAYLKVGANLESTLDAIILRTQQYAKRQETFFRGLFALPAYRSQGSELYGLVD